MDVSSATLRDEAKDLNKTIRRTTAEEERNECVAKATKLEMDALDIQHDCAEFLMWAIGKTIRSNLHEIFYWVARLEAFAKDMFDMTCASACSEKE